jgi:hypothetical protein
VLINAHDTGKFVNQSLNETNIIDALLARGPTIASAIPAPLVPGRIYCDDTIAAGNITKLCHSCEAVRQSATSVEAQNKGHGRRILGACGDIQYIASV